MSCQKPCKDCDSCKKCIKDKKKEKHKRRKKQCSKKMRKEQQTIADNQIIMQDMLQGMVATVKQSIIEELKQNERKIDQFNPWSLTDYDDHNGLNKSLNIVHKKYLYNSVIMADRKIIKLLADRRNIDILSLNIVNYLRYSNMLQNNFDNNLILQSSLNGIQKIFQEYAEIINNTGDNISYTYLPITNADKLKMLFDIIITGRYTNGYLDIGKIIDQFAILLNNAQIEDKQQLSDILEHIKLLLKDDPQLTSWHQLISSYQKMIAMIHPILKQVFTLNIKDENNILLHEANILLHEFYQLGRQIGVFFAFFYAITYFLHYFVNVIKREDNKLAVINDIFNIHIEWWKDHALLICDYNKATALDDHLSSKEIEKEISTSYNNITFIMEETFILFHRLIKVRNLYQILDDLKL